MKNYGGLTCRNIDRYKGHEHIVLNSGGMTLLHLYAIETRLDLLEQALKGGAPLLPDQEHESPLSITLKRKAVRCTHLILNHFTKATGDNPFFNDS